MKVKNVQCSVPTKELNLEGKSLDLYKKKNEGGREGYSKSNLREL